MRTGRRGFLKVILGGIPCLSSAPLLSLLNKEEGKEIIPERPLYYPSSQAAGLTKSTCGGINVGEGMPEFDDPVEGTIWLNTSSDRFYVFNGKDWVYGC